jgi:hypothetical protein
MILVNNPSFYDGVLQLERIREVEAVPASVNNNHFVKGNK